MQNVVWIMYLNSECEHEFIFFRPSLSFIENPNAYFYMTGAE
jgi:hypothetical protein